MDYTLPVEGEWVTISDADLAAMTTKGEHDLRAFFEDRIQKYNQNKCAYFLPHGAKWRAKEQVIDLGDKSLVIPASCYDRKYQNDGIAFLSDWVYDICLLLAPNQVGKSFIGAEWSILRTLPTDPNWEIFTKHGVEYREWTGPKTWVIASYSWDNVATLWQRYRELLPRHELRQWAPRWGMYDGERGAQKDMSFESRRSQSLQLACGTTYKFLCYTQKQMHWEGFDANGGHLDEQPLEEQHVGLNRGFTTKGDYTPIAITLTGHVMEDRPDTGAAGYVKQKLWDARDTKGRTVARYRMDIESVPDSIISAKRKTDLYTQWADPDVQRSEKQQRAAVARYWGGWEEGSGLWIDIWDRRYHVVEPLWADDKTPADWTKWRVIDYGDNGITACLWVALGPKGYAFAYRLLYERGLTIAETCRLIVEMSHNTRSRAGSYKDETTGNIYEIYTEEQGKEVFYETLLDSRSCSQQQQGETLQSIFCRYGVEVGPACGQKNNIQIPRLKDWLRIDFTKPHLTLRDEDGDRVMGHTRLMVFDGRCNDLVDEIESCQRDKNEPSKIARYQADHGIDSLKYWASADPIYMGSQWREQEESKGAEHHGAKFTGY